ncbi:MAG: undecaprenyl-diphosphate phosphatase [Candidatus Omnitrophica bacterium]|nr:undecaprenyl-diphosphate phosphatase [Candidatus Omnitrophota bacterium]
MDILHAVILSIIEGISEFLPISSTGHMIIASHLMHMPQTEFLKTFEIAIQLGAITAVIGLYWRVFLLDWEVTTKVMAAFVPTAAVGLIFYKLVKHYLLGNALVVIWSLLGGGVLIILFERLYRPKEDHIREVAQISYPQAMLIGLCQALAVIPGVSRSAATILSGLMLGVSRHTIVEFSFLLAVPTMLGATVLDLIKTDADLSLHEWGMLALGFAVAWTVALVSVKFFLYYIQRHNFTAFGIYRVIAAVVFAFLLFHAR